MNLLIGFEINLITLLIHQIIFADFKEEVLPEPARQEFQPETIIKI